MHQVDFIAIGPGKSGTSWMYNVFLHHPEICVSSAKETLYFESYYHKGPGWYAKFFKSCDAIKLKGEVSNTYIFSQDAPQRIYEHNPSVKLISALRNPIDRAFSHYLFLLRNGTTQGSFEEAIEEHPDLLWRGKYFELLQKFLQRFSRDQMFITIFEHLKEDPQQFTQELCKFLGVEMINAEDIVNKRVLPAARSRSTLIAKVVKNAAEWMRRLGYPELVTKVKYNKRVTSALYKPYTAEERPVMKDETRRQLAHEFLEDTRALSELLQIDLVQYWNLQP